MKNLTKEAYKILSWKDDARAESIGKEKTGGGA